MKPLRPSAPQVAQPQTVRLTLRSRRREIMGISLIVRRTVLGHLNCRDDQDHTIAALSTWLGSLWLSRTAPSRSGCADARAYRSRAAPAFFRSHPRSAGAFIIRSIAGPPVFIKRQTNKAAKIRKMILSQVV